MNSEKTIEVLKTLIQINNDRFDSCETASKEKEEQNLKNFFGQLTKSSQNRNQEQAGEITKLGTTATDGTKTTGKFDRVWINVKAALTGKNYETIINSCEYGVNMAKYTYQKALENDLENLNAEQQKMIKALQDLLKDDHDKLKSLHNT